jgi:steroid delta-isomerase-like uncharacterized protein
MDPICVPAHYYLIVLRSANKVVPTEGKMVEENVQLVKRWFEEVWNQKRSDTISELVSTDCVAHGTSETGEELHGPEGFRALQARILEAFPDIHFTVHDCFGAGDRVVARWSATMHHRGNGLGMAATGAEVNITGTGMVRMENGKVTEVWDNWDKFAMFQQIESAVRARSASA